MRERIGHVEIGERGTIWIIKEDEWIYPEISLDTGQGEESSFSFQHTPPKKLEKIGLFFIEMAMKLGKEK